MENITIQSPTKPRERNGSALDHSKRDAEIGAAQDVTDLHTVTDAIPIAISILTPEGTPFYINQMALDRVGVTMEEVKRKGHLGLTCHPDDLDLVL